MNQQNFVEWFTTLTGHTEARPWQIDLSQEEMCRSRLIRIPTGLGKTEGVLAAWSYHRLKRTDSSWPRRLVWCLPMRVLVEQTVEVAQRLFQPIPEATRPAVHVEMGGEDRRNWHLSPEQPVVIIGTQDMLLSRALNRGYGLKGRAAWPTLFGLLNQDALWVFDEVQLMDVGLATSAQLQAFRDQDEDKHLRPCRTWWMSATLQPDWLRSVDTAAKHDSWVVNPCEVPAAQRSDGLWAIPKSASTTEIAIDHEKALAERILQEHNKLDDGDFGKVTLVVCNTVDRACQTFAELQKLKLSAELKLVHSRFRPIERETWRAEFLNKDACKRGVNRIIVATQVVEAGVDLSAGCLVTELAPWPSLVQRFGRCARYGGSGTVLVVDRGRNDKQAPPYQPNEVESAWQTIQQLNDVGIRSLEDHEQSLDPAARARLYPYAPAHLLLRKEFDELFDTTPDLTGADLDISRFIRSGDERDLQVFWLKIPSSSKRENPPSPPEDTKARRRELCAVPFLKARDWLCDKGGSKLKSTKRAWVWDWLDGEWKTATRETLLPGRVVCVAADSGGYRTESGFDADFTKPVEVVEPEPQAPINAQPETKADDKQNAENTGDDWETIAVHTDKVVAEATRILQQLSLPKKLLKLIELAARWHDWGKAHPAFQGSIRAADELVRPAEQDLAKAPKSYWPRGFLYTYPDDSEKRPGFRHELASALGLFAVLELYQPNHAALLGPWKEVLEELKQPLETGRTTPAEPEQPADSDMPTVPAAPEPVKQLLECSAAEFNLVAYLVASHHGKVRVALHAAPKDQDYRVRPGDVNGLPIRGIRENDTLPEVELQKNQTIPSVRLTLSPAAMGLSSRTGVSWRERSLGLMNQYGPAGLAYLEAILRAADVRASKQPTTNLALDAETK